MQDGETSEAWWTRRLSRPLLDRRNWLVVLLNHPLALPREGTCLKWFLVPFLNSDFGFFGGFPLRWRHFHIIGCTFTR